MRNTFQLEVAPQPPSPVDSNHVPYRHRPDPASTRRLASLVVFSALLLVAACQTSRRPWGTQLDPSGKCSITWTDGGYAFALPGGIFDLSPYQTRDNLAPRVLHPVSGDFTATVRVTGDFDPGTEPVMPGRAAFFGAGLLVWESPTHYVRLERNEWTYGPTRRQRHGPLFEYWSNQRNLVSNATLDEPFFRGDSTWLRLSRRGDELTAEYSHDGLAWSTYKTVTAPMGPEVQVGVAAISTSKKPFVVRFTGFTIE